MLYFNIEIFIFFKYETIVRSITWSFGHSDPDPSSVHSYILMSEKDGKQVRAQLLPQLVIHYH